jgi:ppGpp synthetase/RelA/SpoT-type nucleotidyltranferase
MNADELIEDLGPILQERGYPPGTVRTWGGHDYKKQKSGKWKKLSKSKGKPAKKNLSKKQREREAQDQFTKAALKAIQGAGLDKLKGRIDLKLPHPPPFSQHIEIAKGAIGAHKRTLGDKLKALAEAAPEGAIIMGRTKKLESAVGKVARKPRYGTADNLQDLTGTRVIMDSVDQVEETVKNLKAKYEIVEEDNYIAKAKDGYRSHHLIAKDENGLEFEIQIRTKNQHTWASWAHDIYKPVNAAQEKAVARHAQEIDDYRLKMSAYFYAKDNPKITDIDNPPCPTVVKSTFGCLG